MPLVPSLSGLSQLLFLAPVLQRRVYCRSSRYKDQNTLWFAGSTLFSAQKPATRAGSRRKPYPSWM